MRLSGLVSGVVNLGGYVGPMFRRLFFPSLVFSAGWALSDIADAVVVGQRLGTTGLAAIGLILPVYMINCTMAHGFGAGGSVRFSMLMAHGDYLKARQSANSTFMTAMAFALATAVLGLLNLDRLMLLLGAGKASAAVWQATREYLSVLVASTPLFYLSNLLNYYLYNDDNQRLGVIGAVVGNISDIVLNVVLVLVFDFGMRGAALSTTLGQVMTISIFVVGLCGREHHLGLLKPVKGWFREGFSSLRSGLATSVSYFYQMIFFFVCNNALLRMGGDMAVAVFDVLQNTSYLMLYLFEGTARAMQPLVSTFHSESGRKDMRSTWRLALVYGGGIGALMVFLVEFRPELLCGLFGMTASPGVDTACIALRIFAVGALFAGTNVLSCSYYLACGRSRMTLLIQSLRGAILLLPLTIAGAILCDLRSFWWIFPITEIGTRVVFTIVKAVRGRIDPGLLPEERVFQRMVDGRTDAVMKADAEIERFCENRGIDPKRCYTITMAVEEICATIVKNGMKDGFIFITLLDEPDGDQILIMRYNDDYFNPFSLFTEKASKDGEFNMDAMGILMIRKQAKDFAYRRYQGLNSLVVRI